MEIQHSLDKVIADLKTKQDAIMQQTKSTIVGGIYTSESLDRTVKEGAQLISDWVDTQTLIDIFQATKDGKL